jgi:hypothetical protein
MWRRAGHGGDQLIRGLALGDVGLGQPQRVMHAGRKFGRDGAFVGLAFREEVTGMLVRKLVELLLRTLNTEGGAVHAVLQVADLGGRRLVGLACPGDGALILGGVAVRDGGAGLFHLGLGRFQLTEGSRALTRRAATSWHSRSSSAWADLRCLAMV